MKVTVRTYGNLKRALGTRLTIELRDDAPFRDLLTELRKKMGATKGLLGHHLIGSTLMVLVNGRNIRSLQGMDTGLKNGDLVTFIPLVEGG